MMHGLVTVVFKGAFHLERTYIVKLRYTFFFIFCEHPQTNRERVFECKNMKVKPLAVILRPTLQSLDKSKTFIAQPMSRDVTSFSIDFMIKKWDRTKIGFWAHL